MSSADFAQILFTVQFDPNDPDWFNRDRFVLSESALLYALLYQIGWLNEDDIKNFRQQQSNSWSSRG